MTSICAACKGNIARARNSPGRLAVAVAVVLLASAFAVADALAADLDKVSAFDIPAESLDKALLEFGTQARVQIMFAWVARAGRLKTRRLKGAYTERSALAALLGGTGLRFVQHGNTIEILGQAHRAPMPSRQTDTSDPPAADGTPEPRKGGSTSLESDKRYAKHSSPEAVLQEVVVTGTHIPGVTEIASPTSSYSQSDIYSTGAGSIGEFMSRLPANFSEVSEMNATVTPSGPGQTIGNGVGAVGFDIHGLGVQSTLVLLNGHRMAAGNDEGNFVDVSMLPLSAIERIDIVKDSASAIYGSDAVGGVVNIVTNTHYDGEETRVRYGKVTQGGRTETTASETAGTSWTGGGGVLSYEYGDETPLAASSRTFSEQALSPYSLLPEQTRHGLYGSITQSLPAGLLLSGFALYGHRTLEDSYFFGGANSLLDSDTVNSLTSEMEIEKDFGPENVARASVEYSMNDSHHMAVLGSRSTPRTYSPDANYAGKSQLAAFDLDYSGALNITGERAVRYAVGGQAREEELAYDHYLPSFTYQPQRTVISEYMEVHVPIVRSILLTAAYRHEHYSDFGPTNNPKVGLEWTPISSVGLSATYSQAFRAPALFDMNPVPSSGLYIALPDPMRGGLPGTCGFLPPPQTGCTPVLVLYGGNASLRPETARSWTTTLAIHPSALPGFKLSLSFYDVKYYDRINSLSEVYGNPLNVLEDESIFGSAIVKRNLPNQEVQQLAQSAGQNLFNYTGVVPGSVTTFVDDRSLNLSRLFTRGIDFDLQYSGVLSRATLSSELDGTRILQYRSQFAPSTMPIDALNTAYNPVSLKVRLRESASVGPVSGSVFVNYTGSYTNNLVTPVVPIASWLTIDASISYRLALRAAKERSAELTIGCLNLGNRNPPYVSNPTYLINFDGANASPLGRFIYAEARLSL